MSRVVLCSGGAATSSVEHEHFVPRFRSLRVEEFSESVRWALMSVCSSQCAKSAGRVLCEAGTGGRVLLGRSPSQKETSKSLMRGGKEGVNCVV